MARVRHKGRRAFPSTAPAPIVNIAQRRALRDPLDPSRRTQVMIAVPTVTGNVNYSIAMTFARAAASSALPECPFHFIMHVEVGKRGPDYARNCIVRTFLHETDADWLVMVDDDQVMPENFWQMCMVRDADVVSGITPVWVCNMDPEAMLRVNNYAVNAKHQCYNLPRPPDNAVQPYRVPIVGTGCIAIRRRVFSPKPHGVGDIPFYFTHEKDRKVQGGEDINFSVECNRAGFTLAVHPGVKFGHIKTLDLEQIETYYRARKAMESQGRALSDDQRISIG